MLPESRLAYRLLIGGPWTCLDFCNTIDERDSPSPVDWLVTYLDLVRWSEHAGNLSLEQADHLLRRAACEPDQADRILEQARALREAIFRIFAATAGCQPVSDDRLAVLNAALADTLNQQQLVAEPEAETFRWAWRDELSLARVVWPVIRGAADLLTSAERDRVRLCPGCGWLFFDQSKNRSRMWCDMRFCGNRAKRKSYYHRHKHTAAD